MLSALLPSGLFRSTRFRSSLLIGSTVLLGSSAALSHETWLLPADFTPAAGDATTLQMTSGMAFPTLGTGIDSTRIREAVLAQGGERESLVPAAAVEGALELSAITAPGVACAWVALHPRVLEIDEEGVAHYLEEIGASDDLWAAWNAQPAPRMWKESYSKLARTYLRSGMGAGDAGACWREVSSARFEILPRTNPTGLIAGASLALDVLFDGQPLAGQAIGLVRAGGKPEPLRRSDADGHITLRFDEAGRYMIYATALRPIEGAEANWESDFITLTVDVQEPPL